MDYRAAIDYLLSFADFERSGRFKDRPDVGPVLALLRALGDPHEGRLTVHVAGSKGKGSVAAMVESILSAAGLRTGLFTSPHLHDYRERIRIGGEMIGQSDLALLVGERLRPAVAAVSREIGDRSFVTFDLLAALGFLAFREHGVEAQVIEVGLGGRVDSTNVFRKKEAAVITPLSYEHTQILGGTIEAIASEKAAIITPGCMAVLAPQAFSPAAEVVRAAAERAGAALLEVGVGYVWKVMDKDRHAQEIEIVGQGGAVSARLPLAGAHQAENAATAVAAVEALRTSGVMVGREAMRRGLESVRWPGRLEVLREEPLVLADGAHNRESARRLAEALREHFGCERVLFIVGASADKDIDGLAEELAPLASEVMAVRTRHPRAMEQERIAAAFRARGIAVRYWPAVSEAIDAAIATTRRSGVICLVGSLFVAAEAREKLLGDRVLEVSSWPVRTDGTVRE